MPQWALLQGRLQPLSQQAVAREIAHHNQSAKSGRMPTHKGPEGEAGVRAARHLSGTAVAQGTNVVHQAAEHCRRGNRRQGYELRQVHQEPKWHLQGYIPAWNLQDTDR